VPVHEVKAQFHMVRHISTGRTLGYGDLARSAAGLAVPARDEIKLKPEAEFRYIGKDAITGVDRADMVTGKAVFGGDIKPEGCLFAVVERPPALGDALDTYDAAETLKVPGVLKVVLIDPPRAGPPFQPLGGIAIVATNTWAAMQGRKVLKASWKKGANADYASAAYRKELEASVRQDGEVVHDGGDIAAALTGSAKHLSAEYYLPHLAHASMETPTATVMKTPAGTWQVWAPVQAPQEARDLVAWLVGAKAESVTVSPTLMGGAFGRKAKPDFVGEAAAASKAMGGAPVKLVWTREDDIQHDYFGTVSLERLEAGLDASGKVAAWRHRTCAPTILATFGPDPKHEAAFERGQGFSNLPFDIPVVRLENAAASAHTRIGWFRSVSNVPHAFAIQSFVAELAHAAGRDHKAFLLDLLGPPRKLDPRRFHDTSNYGEDPALYPIDTGRLRGVIERVTKEIGWGRPVARGRGIGLAAHYSFLSYTACAMEVEVGHDGEVKVIRADLAIDCGGAVNPDRVRAQAEGSVVQGIGIARTSEISFAGGHPEQSNYDGFVVPRFDEVPKDIRVHLIESAFDRPLGGVGEPCLPPVPPAYANAVFAATGRRYRDLPIRSAK
jgi:isoquinoline 1-oxidoreductase beta subunit